MKSTDCIVFCAILGIVLGRIDFTIKPESQTVVFGHNVILDCNAVTDGSGTLVYSWYHDGNQLTSSIFANHSLLIVNVDQNTLGNYTCHVTGNNNTTISASAILIQAYIRPFLSNPSSLTVTEGEVASLDCVTGDSAPPSEVHWEKDGIPVTSGNQYKASYGTHASDMVGQYYMKLVLDSKPGETGLYACVSINSVLGITVRSLSVQVTVNAVEAAPYIDPDITQNSTVMSPQGFPLTLNCAIGGFPRPVITWYKLQNRIVSDSRISVLSNGSLSFVSLTTIDQGYYYCEGKNYLGLVRVAEIYVQVSYIDLLFKEEPDSSYATAGQPVILHCSPPISYPPANVTWYKNNQPFKYRTGEYAVNIVDLNAGIWDLFFTNIQKQDEGRYFCVATNDFALPKTRTSKYADLQIGGGPAFIDPPQSTSVIKGEGTQMKCTVSGDPFPRITWLLDGNGVQLDNTMILRNKNQELHMAKVNKVHEGVYTCRAENVYGVAEATAFLKVLVPPVLVNFKESVTVTAKQDLVLPCFVNGDPSPSIQWMKDGSDVVSDDRIIIKQDELEIREAILEDSGIYTCHAFNSAGSVVAMATVTVNMKPDFIKSPFDKTVTLGLSVTMECEVKGYPLPSITWLFNGTNLLPPGTMIANDNELSVAIVTWRHVGLYTCVASNILGASTKEGKLSVNVMPRIAAINGDPVVFVNHVLELTCSVAGIPKPTVNWYFQDLPYYPSLDGRVVIPAPEKMIIKYTKASDAGEYKCVATNLVGTTEFSITVSIIEPPLPPVLLDALSLTSTSVTLTWTPATQKPNTIISMYLVYYKTEIEADYRRLSVTADSTDSQIVVNGLSPGIVYMFVMSSVNPAGEGNHSNVLSEKTMDSGPSQPRNLKVLSVNSSSVTLEWEIPAQTNGQIRKYQVFNKVKGENSALISVITDKDVNKPLLSIVVHDLLPFTLYEFKVRGATQEGGQDLWGNLTDNVEVKTSPIAPSSEPQITDIQTLSTSMVQLGWQVPPLQTWHGQDLKYRISYIDLNFTSDELQLSITDTVVNVTGLFPWRWYSFVLEIGNEAGWGKRSDPVISHTKATAPDLSPLISNISALPNQQVLVIYQLPDPRTWNSQLNGLIVQYITGSDSRTKTVENIQGEITISGLLPWTQYRIRLAVYTDLVTNGNGPYSDWFPVKTSEATPGKVTNVQHQATPTSMTLTWTVPPKPNGVILYYIVEYRESEVKGNPLNLTRQNEIERIKTETTSAVLENLSPGHVYIITIMAVNSVGAGEQFDFHAATVLLPTVPTEPTTEEIMTTATFTTGNTLGSKGDNSFLSSAVFGGIVTGSVFVVMVIILVTCLCIRRKRQDQSKYAKNPDVFGNIDGNKSLGTKDRGAVRRIDFTGEHTQYGSNSKTEKDNQSAHVSALEVPDRKLLKNSNTSIHGIENPGYSEGRGGDTESIAVSMTLSSEDLLSQGGASLKRTSRMKSESAAAIAVMRNKRLPRLPKSMDDTDTLINHDSVVVYTERTAL